MTALDDDGTYNIVAKTMNNYYYGGYYSDYAGKAEENKVGVAYTGGDGSWKYADAGRIDGREMRPDAGKTYYLKEIPLDYLNPYIHVVYDKRSTNPTNELKKMFLMTGLDDANYRSFGLEVNDAYKSELVAAKMGGTFEIRGTKNKDLTVKSIWGADGYLGIWDQSTTLKPDLTFSYQPYVVTPDGIKVYGAMTRTVYTQGNYFDDTFRFEGTVKINDQTHTNKGIYRVNQIDTKFLLHNN